MSSHQQSIADYVTESPTTDFEGARYTWDRPRENPVQEEFDGECRNCGNHVTNDFARVFGDNDNIVHHCPSCVTAREIFEGGASE